MDRVLEFPEALAEQNRRIDDAVRRDRPRLRNFIRRRVADDREAEQILQEVFYELVVAYRLMKPIEQVSAWLFRVARNRITDLFRKKKPVAFSDLTASVSEEGEELQLEDLLPSTDAGPDAAYARSVLIEELDAALDELFDERNDIAHKFRRARCLVRHAAIQRLEIGDEFGFVFACKFLERRFGFANALDDFVLDVRDIHHVRDVVTLELEITPHEVGENEGAPIADVREIVNRQAAAIHARGFSGRVERREFLHRTRKCVE